MLQGIQPHAGSDGGRSRAGGKNNFDLRRINGVYTADWGAVRIGEIDGYAKLRCGVGGGEEDVLLQAALRSNGRRKTAISYVTRFDDGYGGLGDARVIHFGECEDGDNASRINGRGRRGRGGSGNGSRRGVSFNAAGIRGDG